jgi:hypothetical protein
MLIRRIRQWGKSTSSIKTGKGLRGEGARRWVAQRSSIRAVASGIGEEEVTTMWKLRVMDGEGK